MARGRARWATLLWLWLPVVLFAAMETQTPGLVAQESKPYTLHVNVRLMQVPALVLGSSMALLPDIGAEQFILRLDKGPKFHPSAARLEGNDPITLVVLLDLSGGEPEMIEAIQQNLASWVKGSLGPQDRVAFYGMDCALVRMNGYLRSDSSEMQTALENVIRSPLVHGVKTKPACGRTVRLWDSIAVVSRQLADAPGRRVILAVSDGFDGHSTLKPEDVRGVDIEKSITIFGLMGSQAIENHWARDRFGTLCQSTGGLEMTSNPASLPHTFEKVIEMLRGRYILEFTEPSNMTAGIHRIDVSLPHESAFIRTAGVSAVLDDPEAEKDPTVLPRDTSKAPVMGKERPKERW